MGFVYEPKDKLTEPLKRCPFCGGAPRALGGHVYCSECHAATTIFNNTQEAATAWNRRDKTPEPFDMEYLFDDDLPEPEGRKVYTVRR